MSNFQTNTPAVRTLSAAEIGRYERQLILPRWGEQQQLAVAGITVELPGTHIAGAIYLAAAGIGTIRLVGHPADDLLLAQLRAANPALNVIDCSLHKNGSPNGNGTTDLFIWERIEAADAVRLIIRRRSKDAQIVIFDESLPEQHLAIPVPLQRDLEGIYLANAVLRSFASPSISRSASAHPR